MFKRGLIFVMLMMLLVACDSVQSTNDRSTDPQSAQNLMPNIVGFTRNNADSMIDALTAAGGSAALASGNAPVAAAFVKIDSMIQCYQDVGAAAAMTYVQQDIANAVVGGTIPAAGAVAIINVDRIKDNFLNCALGQGVSAQSATLEPCAGSGSFTYEGDTITYLYGATSQTLCDTFQLHFNNVAANQN